MSPGFTVLPRPAWRDNPDCRLAQNSMKVQQQTSEIHGHIGLYHCDIKKTPHFVLFSNLDTKKCFSQRQTCQNSFSNIKIVVNSWHKLNSKTGEKNAQVTMSAYFTCKKKKSEWEYPLLLDPSPGDHSQFSDKARQPIEPYTLVYPSVDSDIGKSSSKTAKNLFYFNFFCLPLSIKQIGLLHNH